MKKTISIQLTEEDLMTIEQILLDRDGELALKFVQDKIQPVIKESQSNHCKH